MMNPMLPQPWGPVRHFRGVATLRGSAILPAEAPAAVDILQVGSGGGVQQCNEKVHSYAKGNAGSVGGSRGC